MEQDQPKSPNESQTNNQWDILLSESEKNNTENDEFFSQDIAKRETKEVDYDDETFDLRTSYSIDSLAYDYAANAIRTTSFKAPGSMQNESTFSPEFASENLHILALQSLLSEYQTDLAEHGQEFSTDKLHRQLETTINALQEINRTGDYASYKNAFKTSLFPPDDYFLLDTDEFGIDLDNPDYLTLRMIAEIEQEARDTSDYIISDAIRSVTVETKKNIRRSNPDVFERDIAESFEAGDQLRRNIPTSDYLKFAIDSQIGTFDAQEYATAIMRAYDITDCEIDYNDDPFSYGSVMHEDTGKISINPNNSTIQNLSTIPHELTHIRQNRSIANLTAQRDKSSDIDRSRLLNNISNELSKTPGAVNSGSYYLNSEQYITALISYDAYKKQLVESEAFYTGFLIRDTMMTGSEVYTSLNIEQGDITKQRQSFFDLLIDRSKDNTDLQYCSKLFITETDPTQIPLKEEQFNAIFFNISQNIESVSGGTINSRYFEDALKSIEPKDEDFIDEDTPRYSFAIEALIKALQTGIIKDYLETHDLYTDEKVDGKKVKELIEKIQNGDNTKQKAFLNRFLSCIYTPKLNAQEFASYIATTSNET